MIIRTLDTLAALLVWALLALACASPTPEADTLCMPIGMECSTYDCCE